LFLTKASVAKTCIQYDELQLYVNNGSYTLLLSFTLVTLVFSYLVDY